MLRLTFTTVERQVDCAIKKMAVVCRVCRRLVVDHGMLPSTLDPDSLILPHQLMQYLHFLFHAYYTFFYLRRFMKIIADDQCFPITKGSIYHINHVHTTFYPGLYHSSGLTRNWMFNVRVIFADTAFLLGTGSNVCICHFRCP